MSRELTMMTHRIRTIGISILGGKSGVEGRYELGLDEIKAVSEVRHISLAPALCSQRFLKDDLDVVPRSVLLCCSFDAWLLNSNRTAPGSRKMGT